MRTLDEVMSDLPEERRANVERLTEPLRHEASLRNRRKALHHAECGLEEVQFIRNELTALDDKCRYAIGRLHRIINRLKAELV